MKQTVTVNLNGCVYTIDDDAFAALKSYLEKVKLHLATEEGCDEIMTDIEARIAELFDERMRFGGLNVMTIKEVEEIIATLGHPEDFEVSHDNEYKEEPSKEEAPKVHRKLYRNNKNKAIAGVCTGLADYFSIDVVALRLAFVALLLLGGSSLIIYILMWIIVPVATEEQLAGATRTNNRKRLYRDMDNKMLGGVCAGIAAYTTIDTSLVRLIAVGTGIIFSWMYPITSFIFLSYIIAWIIVPRAETAAQKIEMRGDEPNVENIRKFVQDATERSTNAIDNGIRTVRERNIVQRIFGFIGEAFMLLFKFAFGLAGGCLGCLGVMIIVPILFGLVVALIALVFNPVDINLGLMEHGMTNKEMLALMTNPRFISMNIISFSLLVGVPLLSIIYSLIAFIFKLPPISKKIGWSLFAVWIVGIIITGIFAFFILKDAGMLMPSISV